MIGWHQEIEKLDREDALAFYRRFYAPNNAILVIAGDVTVDEVRPMVEANFGKVARTAFDPGAAHPSAGAGAGRAPHRDARRSQVEQPSVKRYYLVPSSTTAASGESPALDVLAQLMGGSSNSYLYRALVVDHPLAVDASASYQSASLDASQFVDRGGAAARRRVRADRAGVRQGHDPDIAQHPPAAEDLERVKTQLIAEAIYAQDNQATMARWYGGGADHGLEHRGHQKLAGPHPRGDRRAGACGAQKWLDKKRSVTGYLIKDTAPKREEKRS